MLDKLLPTGYRLVTDWETMLDKLLPTGSRLVTDRESIGVNISMGKCRLVPDWLPTGNQSAYMYQWANADLFPTKCKP